MKDLYKFNPKDAMKTHASAQAASTAKAKGEWTKDQKIGLAIWAAIALILLSAVFNSGSNTPTPIHSPTATSDTNGPRTVPSGPHEDTRKTLALLINMRGELCARVDSVRRIEGDTYAVSCTRYRDGSGSATYEVNAATGNVK